MSEQHDTIIIGGGQAGLVMSYYLTQLGREHVILERRRVAESWRSERWDSLAFQFPNWSIHLPGYAYQADREAFAHRDEVIRFLEDYAALVRAPVRCGVDVVALRQKPASERFLIETRDATLEARAVVIATGPFQRAKTPALSADLPADICQVHASTYRNPEQLPPGSVLIVGAGASGCQIAEELYQCGRTVYFSVSRHRRILRRYRGQDLLSWLMALGRVDQTRDSLPDGKVAPPFTLSGVGGGREIDLRRFAADGVVLLGYLRGVDGTRLVLEDNVEQLLREADAAAAAFKSAVDEHVRATAVDVPEEDVTHLLGPGRWRPKDSMPELNLRVTGITSVIWCTGYRDDYGWVKLPILDLAGHPVQTRGVTVRPGAYFLGLRWMHKWKSGFLFGVGEDAAYLAEQMKTMP
jgi:putative flavoprotein involved in K+ transport